MSHDYVIQARHIPTLLGLKKSPSPWELWHVLKGNIASAKVESARGFWSRRLHPEILMGLQERYRCILSDRSKQQMTPTNHITCRNLVEIRSPGELPVSFDTKHLHIVQMSSENYSINWNINGVVQAPPYIIAELHPAMAALGVECLAVALVVAGGEHEAFVEIDFDPRLWNEIKAAASEFVFSLDMNDEPAPDFAIDGRAIEMRYRPTSLDEKDLKDDVLFNRAATEYRTVSQELQTLERDVREKKKTKDQLKARIITALGDHASAAAKDWLVTRTETRVPEQLRAAYSFSTLNIESTAPQA